MNSKSLGLLLLSTLLVGCPNKVENTFVSSSETWDERPAPVRVQALTAMADLSSPESIGGQITFEENELGTTMRVNLTGLTPESNYQVKIHRIGDCSANFSLMGPPFVDPKEVPNNLEEAEPEGSDSTASDDEPEEAEEAEEAEPVGILTEIEASPSGKASQEILIDPLMLSAGPLSIRHRSVVIHGKSTLRSRRREDSSPVACGIIDPSSP